MRHRKIPKLRRKYLKRVAAYEKRRKKKIDEVEEVLDDKPEVFTFGSSVTGRTSSKIRFLPPFQNIKRRTRKEMEDDECHRQNV